MSLVPLMVRKDFSSGNPGDVYIALGLQYLLNKVFGNLQYFYLNKFSKSDFEQNKWVLEDSKYLIYAGTPQYNNYDDWCLWYDWGVWKDFIIPMNLDFYTIAGGAGFPSINMSVEEFTNYCLSSNKTSSILNSRGIRTKLNTVRDKYAFDLIQSAGFEVSLLPCTATWSGLYANISKNTISKKVLLVPPNYKSVAPEILNLSSQEQVYNYIYSIWMQLYNFFNKSGFDVEFVCHWKEEYFMFKNNAKVFFTNDVFELLRKYSTAETLISARLHACLPAYGIGVENILSIKIDTRGSAVDMLSIPTLGLDKLSVENVSNSLDKNVENKLLFYEEKYLNLFDDKLNILRK